MSWQRRHDDRQRRHGSWSRSRKLTDHIFLPLTESRARTGSGERLQTSNPTRSAVLPPRLNLLHGGTSLQQGSITSPNSTTDWAPSVQIYGPLGKFPIQTITVWWFDTFHTFLFLIFTIFYIFIYLLFTTYFMVYMIHIKHLIVINLF